MKNVHKTTILDRLKRAYEAFRCKPICSIHMGIDIKRCDECKYREREPYGIRDNLLVTAGCIAGMMSELNYIVLPDGLSGENELAMILAKAVDRYMNEKVDKPFDTYIEDIIVNNFVNLDE